ncbi:MAG: hypothetical protein KDI98_05360 [Hyphomicrobiaceae bacterium]|nr:hypothetical protein [Hyphomicrobiaceae bacterium]
MAEDLIRYDVLVSEALRGVVRKVLAEVAKTGLPGEHHFYITFDTRVAGVRVSSSLKARFPEELTIVLQHQFWDLQITDHAFEVGLSFGGMTERLTVPFAAVTGFHDPSCDFALKFETLVISEEDGNVIHAVSNDVDDEDVPVIPAPAARPVVPAIPRAAASLDDDLVDAEDDVEDGSEEGETEEGDKVVSLDAFRKKT